MRLIIAILVILTVCFFIGLVLGAVASDHSPEEQAREDRDQIEFLRAWREKQKRS